jgi:imidazolonepropionase-like amidohydrolase
MLTESIADYTIRSGRNVMDALRTGFTGVRTMGDRDFIDVAWKRAFNSGLLVGPRMFVCGYYICATGGHAHNWPGAVQIDGPLEMRKVVREQLKHGVDHIKIAVTGGVATAGESMQESQLFLEEIQAATEVAHQKGKKVAVHGGGPGGIKMAIRGGVDCIEHGYYTDDETIELMRERDVFFVPTLFITQDEAFMHQIGMADYQIAKARGAAEAHREGFRKALAAGVKIACGSDASPIGAQSLNEIEQLVRCGMTPMQALIAATRNGAELCGVLDQLGTVEVGKRADLLGVTANPLDNISNLRSLQFVMKDGHLVDTKSPEGLGDFLSIVWER